MADTALNRFGRAIGFRDAGDIARRDLDQERADELERDLELEAIRTNLGRRGGARGNAPSNSFPEGRTERAYEGPARDDSPSQAIDTNSSDRRYGGRKFGGNEYGGKKFGGNRYGRSSQVPEDDSNVDFPARPSRLPEDGTEGPNEGRIAPQSSNLPEDGTERPNESGRERVTASAPVVSSARGPAGGGGGALDTRWKSLGDQTRTAAFDPNKDAADPRNIHMTDADGRVNLFGPAAAVAAGRTPQRTQEGGDGLNPMGSSQGMSSNNVAHDLTPALGGAMTFAKDQFHQGKRDEHTDAGYQAMVTHGVGTPSPDVMHSVFAVVDPKEELPMNRRMELATKTLYDFYTAKGMPGVANKAAYEVVQFGNKMAKGHGEQAVEALKSGDMGRAVHELQAGYGWLPDGHTAEVHGNNIVLMNREGDPVQNFPIDPKTVGNLALGMSSGQLGWDVIRSRAEAGGGQPPAAPSAPTSPTAQPPAAAAGPTTPAPAAPTTPGAPAAIDAKSPVTPAGNTAPVPGAPVPPPAGEETPTVIRRETDGGAPAIAEARSHLQMLNKEYIAARLELTNDIRKHGLNPKNPVDRKMIEGAYAGLDKRHADAQKEFNDRLRAAEQEGRASDAAERKALEPKHPQSQTEIAMRAGEYEKQASRYDKSSDPLMKQAVQVSPLRFLKTPEERQPIYDLAASVQAHNPDLPAQRALDLVVAATSHVGGTVKTKDGVLVSMNGKTGKDGTRYKILGSDLKKNPVIEVDGERVHLPKNALKAINDLRLKSYAKAVEAEKEAEEKKRQDNAPRTKATPSISVNTKGMDPAARAMTDTLTSGFDATPPKMLYDYNKALIQRGIKALTPPDQPGDAPPGTTYGP